MMIRTGKRLADSLPMIACAATVALLVPVLTTLGEAEDIAESPPPFVGFAVGQEGKDQQKEWREALDAEADQPGAPPRETIERMKRAPPQPGETMDNYARRMGVAQSEP